MSKELAKALTDCLISPNVSDSNGEQANIVDVIDKAARNLYKVAAAITDPGAASMPTPDGGQVGNLTEATIFVAHGLFGIATAIDGVASAIEGLAAAVQLRSEE